MLAVSFTPVMCVSLITCTLSTHVVRTVYDTTPYSGSLNTPLTVHYVRSTLECCTLCGRRPDCRGAVVGEAPGGGRQCELHNQVSVDRARASNAGPRLIRKVPVAAALLPDPAVTCEASSAGLLTGCERAIDGDLTTEWVSSILTSSPESQPWVSLTLPQRTLLIRAVVWMRCQNTAQFRSVRFDTDTPDELTHMCNGSPECSNVTPDEVYFPFKNYTFILKLTGLGYDCGGGGDFTGFRELQLYGIM